MQTETAAKTSERRTEKSRTDNFPLTACKGAIMLLQISSSGVLKNRGFEKSGLTTNNCSTLLASVCYKC